MDSVSGVAYLDSSPTFGSLDSKARESLVGVLLARLEDSTVLRPVPSTLYGTEYCIHIPDP